MKNPKTKKTPRVRHREPSQKTKWQLYGISGNTCAWPGCPNEIFSLDHNATLVGEACHIKGRTDQSPRFDPDQSEDDNRSIKNLIGMCSIHHKIVDSKENEAEYPVDKLLLWKETHERRAIDKADRSWIKPANFISAQFLNEDGKVVMSNASFWIDRDGRPQVYDDRKLAVVNLLREFYLDISILSTLQKTINDNPQGLGKDFQQYGMKHHFKGSAIAHLLRVMATVPDITFAELLNYLVEGNDATGLIENMATEFEKVVRGSMTLKEFLEITDDN